MSAIQLPHHITPPALMEVIGLRTMPGQACSHVVGVLHKTSFCSCNVQSHHRPINDVLVRSSGASRGHCLSVTAVVDGQHPSKQKDEHGLYDVYVYM